MQRRNGKGLAHITPPTGHHHGRLTEMSPSEKSSRFNQRSLGVTNRIWAILLLFLFIIIFTHYALPSNNTHNTHRYNYLDTGLKSKNYLNKTREGPEPNPFEFCPVFGPGDEIGKKYGPLTLSQSRLHLGSGGRVQRVIHKALLGQPITISVLGGSGTCTHLLPSILPTDLPFICSLQCLPVTAQGTILFLKTVTPPVSFGGGTLFSLTQLLSSRMEQCVKPIRHTLGIAMGIIYRM